MTGNDQQNQAPAPKSKQPVQQLDPNAVPPSTPAPRSYASEEVTFLAQRASQMSKDIAAKKMDDPGIPDAARTDVGLADAKFVPLPAGGIAALADHLYPGDRGNIEAMAGHVFDLLTLNRDIVRDDTSSTVGTIVRIP